MTDKRPSRVFFLSVPENLSGQIGECFTINPAIPIPVELPAGEEQPNLEELSWEAIISGMLLVITEGKEQREWIDYYREFVIAVRPGILDEFTEAAIIKAQSGDFDLALEILNALHCLYPASPAVALNRALVLEQQAALLELHAKPEAEALFQAAEEAYAHALALHPVLPDVFFNAGFFYLGRTDFRRARECFAEYADSGKDKAKREKATSIIRNIDRDGLGDDSFAAAYELVKQGDDQAGMERIHNFIAQHPTAWNGWFVLGWALRRMGRWEDGAQAFGKAVELGGRGSDVYNELAICLMEAGDLKGARQKLETALRHDPENVKIISNMGVLALKANNKTEADGFFRAVLELDPEDVIARKLLNG